MPLPLSFHTFLFSNDWKIESNKNFLASSVNERIYGDTPLTRVLKDELCSYEIVKLLLDFGADVNCEDSDGDFPLVLALRYLRNEAIIEALLQKGAVNLSKVDIGEYICIALSYGATKGVIKLLLNAGCSLVCGFHRSVFHCASCIKKIGLKKGVLELLRDSGVKLESTPSTSPICYALDAGCDVQDIQLLMRRGIALNMCQMHSSPWFCATDQFCRDLPLKTDIVKLISESGFSMDVLNENDGWSPLQCALLKCEYQIGAIKMMVEELGVQGFGKYYGSLLHLAVSSHLCKLEVVKLLVDAGLGVNHLNSEGEHPLHRAVMSKTRDLPEILKYLLDQGSSVELINKDGYTPMKKLMIFNSNYSAIKVLLEAGASIDSYALQRMFYKCNFNSKYGNSSSLRILVKFSCLRNPDFKIKKYIECLGRHKRYWKNLAAQCAKEVRKLDSELLHCEHSLRDFLLGSCKHLIYVDDAHSEMNICNSAKFLRTIADKTFRLFLPLLAAKVGKKLLKLHLETKSVYTISDKRKVRLNNDSLDWLMRYLAPADILKMIIAYQ